MRTNTSRPSIQAWHRNDTPALNHMTFPVVRHLSPLQSTPPGRFQVGAGGNPNVRTPSGWSHIACGRSSEPGPSTCQVDSVPSWCMRCPCWLVVAGADQTTAPGVCTVLGPRCHSIPDGRVSIPLSGQPNAAAALRRNQYRSCCCRQRTASPRRTLGWACTESARKAARTAEAVVPAGWAPGCTERRT